MRHRKKVDTTLKERHGILHLLERLKQENITLSEMEEIGDKLGKSGRRALQPLVRRLWRERSGDLISKYTYLLDFFEEEVWLDQLIQITLKRRDLGEEAKTVLLAVLQGYGVDVSSPPFSLIFADVSGPLSSSLPRVLDRGSEGITSFLDQFLAYPQEIQLLVIRELPLVADPRIVSLLEVLLRLDNRELVEGSINALGRVRDRGAVQVLHHFKAAGDQSLLSLVERNLRRLSFLGIDTSPCPPPVPRAPFYTALAAPLDGDGGSSLLIARGTTEGTLEVLFLQTHEQEGIVASWGRDGLTREEFDRELEDIRTEEGLVTVSTEYAILLLRDSLYRGRDLGPLPADYYVRQEIFHGEDMTPAPYEPLFDGYARRNRLSYAEGDTITACIFEDDFFDGWFMANCRVYDFAEEWAEQEKLGGGKPRAKALESILERFCRELLAPEKASICRRMLLNADLLRHTRDNRELVKKTVDLARSLDSFALPYHHHPFLRRFALESMDMAREALAEGYDLREHQDEWDDEDQ